MSSSVTLPTSSNPPDIALRASDGVVIRTNKILLIYASPFFSNLLVDGQPDETLDGLPLCPLAEHSEIVCAIIRLCAPVNLDIKDILPAFYIGGITEALNKYMMDGPCKRLMDALRIYISDESTDALCAFALARHFGLDDVLGSAVGRTLRTPIMSWPSSVPELTMILASDYHRLVQYFLRCGEEVTAVAGKWKLDTGRKLCGVTSCQSLSAPKFHSRLWYDGAQAQDLSIRAIHVKAPEIASEAAVLVTKLVSCSPGADITQPLTRYLLDASNCVATLESRQEVIDEMVGEVSRCIKAAISRVSHNRVVCELHSHSVSRCRSSLMIDSNLIVGFYDEYALSQPRAQ